MADTGVAAVIDVETTGFSASSDEVVELGLVLFSFDRSRGHVLEIVAEYGGLRDPGRPIPASATDAHGLTWDDVRGHALDETTVRGLLQRAEFLIAHNSSFDRGFVVRLFPEAAALPWACSMNGVAWYTHGFRSKALQSLLAAHRIGVDHAHRALDDARNTLRLLAVERPDGTTYLTELLRSGRA
jgi:DNA polymerase III subunit epsilon